MEDEMNAQHSKGRVRQTAGDKFPEPKGWSLNWDGHHVEPARDNGRLDKFPEPRSWSAEWDGSVLSELQTWYNASTRGSGSDTT
jgi:hypothetical protein